jgi:hypothetical protein
MLICVALSVASCKTVGASDGAGYAVLHPNAATREFIFANDKPFTQEVGAHNIQCGKDPMCRK